jgi:hypothetical protein
MLTPSPGGGGGWGRGHILCVLVLVYRNCIVYILYTPNFGNFVFCNNIYFSDATISMT